MALTCTVVGQFLDSGGNPQSGTVVFRPSVPVVTEGAGDIVISEPIRVFMDATGRVSATLPATNDPTTNPTGFTYGVSINVIGLEPRSFSISAPSGSTVDLITVIPVVSSSGTASSISAILATTAETIAGTSTSKANTPAGLTAKLTYVDASGYGVVFDGATDNSTALQNAINAAPTGVLVFRSGEARFATPLDLSATQCLRVAGQSGGGQNGINPATRLVYTGGNTSRVFDVRGRRGIEFENLAIQHTSDLLTGYLLDLAGTASADGTRHVLRRVLLGSTSPTTVKTAVGVNLDGCYDAELTVGLVGLANGLQGQIPTGSGGRNFSHGVRLAGGYGALIDGFHVLNAGNGWLVEGYVAQAKADGTPNFLSIPSTVIAPTVSLVGVHFADGTTTTGSWVQMAAGTLSVVGGYYRIGGGEIVKLTANSKMLSIIGATVVHSSALTGAVIDGGGFTASSLIMGGNRLTDSNFADKAASAYVRNLTVSGGMVQRADEVAMFGKVGFYGTTPIVQQTGVAVTAAAIHAALVNLGLITA